MSKIICDVCGTTYPETADQCPICGSAKPEEPGIAEESSENTYEHVKGGRFSKGNVRKRNKERGVVPMYYDNNEDDEEDDDEYEDDEPERSNKGLTIVVIVLLLAIAAVVLYIYFTYLAPDPQKTDGTTGAPQTTTQIQPGDDTQPQNTTQGTESTEPSEPDITIPEHIACTGIDLSAQKITLGNVGDAYLLNVTLEPVDTTEFVTFGSSDPSVATVDANGKITAVGNGTAVITVTCGGIRNSCDVTCNIEEVEDPTTEPTTEPTEPTEPAAAVKLNRTDITFSTVGESWDLYSGTVRRNQVIFSSDNEEIVTFVNGVATAVGPGTTTVRAEYNGTKVSCIIRCKIPVPEDPTQPSDPTPTDPTQPGEQDPTEPGEDQTPETQTYSISSTDVTMAVGETFILKLTDSEGKTVQVNWTADKENIVAINGNAIKALSKGTTTVTYTIGETVYSCIVRVKTSW